MNMPLKLVIGFAIFMTITLVLGTIVDQQFSGAETALKSLINT